MQQLLYITHRQVLGTNTTSMRKKVRVDSRMNISAAAVAPVVVLPHKKIHVPLLNDASQIDYCRY